MTSSGRTDPARDDPPLAQGALTSAPAERNKQPILEVLERVLPRTGVVLEIASGTGQHVAHFARAKPRLVWQPTEPDVAMHASIRAHVAAVPYANVREPLALDVSSTPWPIGGVDAIVCINMIHIAPRAASTALFAGAAECLAAGAPLVLYGPFKRHGAHTAPSNAAFDADLKARNPAWGVRALETVTLLAHEHGFALEQTVSMPANNFVVVYRRR
jgi:SAM-dependent methyltransferase